MTANDDEQPSALELSNFETAWWDAVLEAEHWLKVGVVTPVQAALLLSGLNPHEGDVEHHRQADVFDDLRRLHERFVAQSSSDHKPRSLAGWLAYAEANDLKHSSWVRRYLDAVGGKNEDAVAANKGWSPSNQVLISKRSSWWAHSQHYIVCRMLEWKCKTAKELYSALRNESPNNDSPFEVLSSGGVRELFVRGTGRVLALKTIQTRWPEIQAAVAKSSAT